MEADDEIDSGLIWEQRDLHFDGSELYDEINQKLFATEISLMDDAITKFGKVIPRKQQNTEATYYRRRTANDSRIDPERPLSEQFDLLRVADPERFPAFFEWRGCRYQIQLKKVDKEEGPGD